MQANTTYLVRVAARNPAGLSDWMGPKEFRTHAKVDDGTHSLASIYKPHPFLLNAIQFIVIVIAFVSANPTGFDIN